MTTLDAALSGTFSIGGDLTVNRLGFGAMRITGKGIWGPPEDPEAAKATLRRLPELNVDFVDTAESYGPYVSEDLIGEVLAPYAKGTIIATKSGLTRTGPDEWPQLGRPEFLRQGAIQSLRRLKVEVLDLWQLHRIDAKVPRADQFGAIAQLQKDGIIRHAGLSEVSVDDIKEAGKYFKVTTVQNMYNLVSRKAEDVLDYCEANGIGFIPWRPIDGGNLESTSTEFKAIMDKHEASASQLALAWMLKRSPVMLPIPGTGKVKHLEENIAAAAIKLSDDEFKTLDRIGRQA
ncbi:aldo/keto reductase [Devosia psychrophila]|jgi:aryl-alcohol dehydrogenase-like predicted oxidoreductase|uniref:Oxidoreductase n=1 Tax=Devosia psychrophila TaxID=728005 RepID=A0A0F5PWB1_9HYPH|nr:aldo/keto reductase [Devosia psychrophila]KKC32094.1 oxidoreductase [Devosia psychrophila]SFD20209.1 Predicted oxidoreductase [Devosia psychrophila]